MADDVDYASELEERRIDDAMAEVRLRREAENKAREHLSERECEECGEIIPIKRLKVVPLARLCINCQTEMEK